ncbi:MAG: DUF1801 domain-containing protein [Dehalococcoidia bacterium]
MPARKKASETSSAAGSAGEVKLLSGGNPQIPMGYGDEPVQAYIAAMPEWKSDLGRRLDALITKALPKARKAVKWNSPFYGIEDVGWLVSLHCYTKYVQVTFLNGASLDPLPPVGSKDPNTRYLNIREHDELDERQFVAWVRQAAKHPGWVTGDIASK